MADNKFLDDIAKFGNSTITAMSGMQRQVRKWASEQFDELVTNMDLVKRNELDVYKELAQKALTRAEELEKRVEALEAKKAATAAAPKKAVAKKKA